MGALTVVIAAAPSLLLLAYFYLRDRFEREPLGHLALAYFLGMYAMVAAHGISTYAESALPAGWLAARGEGSRLVDAFVLTGLLEELAKWVPLMTAVYHWSEFDEPLDGVIYGVAISLGFATLENLLYLERMGLHIAWQRAVFAVPAHALFGGAMGYYAGRAKFDKRTAPRRRARLTLDFFLTLALPTAFHGLYDFALLHGLGWKIWVAITALSLALWAFVLRRVHRAQRASPYRPKTMPPSGLRAPRG
jgi:RsiW-degrading membrane proteinase PrsW (M82 family)